MSNELSTVKSIAQARAKFAWECADKQGNKDNKEYGSVVNKIPTYIKTNGLLNTLAFLYSKKSGSGKQGEVLANIHTWLTDKKNKYHLLPDTLNTDAKLLEHLTDPTKVTARDLIQCTTEVLALFNWLRRFAKSE